MRKKGKYLTRFGLVVIEGNATKIWTLRLFSFFIACFFFYLVYQLLDTGIYKKLGNIYTKNENPISFYVGFLKYLIFFLVSFWFSYLGTYINKNGEK